MKFKTRTPMAVLTRPATRNAAESTRVRPSRLLRPTVLRTQARVEKPRVFCDPRMPGSWREIVPASLLPEQAA